MGRVYREMRAGKLESQDGTRLVYVLMQLREMAMTLEIEQRVAALEERNVKNGRQDYPAR